MSFLRKQESRLLCACSGVPVWQAGPATWTAATFWIPAFAGMTPLSQLRFALEPSFPGVEW